MNVKIDIYLIISIVILLLFKQIEGFLIFYFFIILHEISHILVALCLKIKPLEVNFLPFGVNAKFDFLNYRRKEIIVALAGPIFSSLVAYYFPQYRVQNLFIAIMNMMPIYPLDGGRVLKNSMILKYGIISASKKYLKVVRIFCILLMIFNIILIVFQKNYRFLFVSFYIFQIVGDEIKKDKIRLRIKELLNIEI